MNQRDDQQQQTTVPVTPVASVQQPVTDVQGQGSTPPSVTPGGKEAAPVPTQMGEVADYVAPAAYETAPVLEQAVEDAGVEVSTNPEELQVTKDQQAVGITPAKEATPVVTTAQPAFVTPMTLQQAEQAASGKPDKSSTWLGKLVVFVFGQEPYRKELE